MSAIPIVVLSGYLGSGKTTALNHLLASEPFAAQNTALIINEFGTLGVDGALVRADAAEKYEINRGSLFCACTKVELLNVLTEIANDPRPDVVLVEATGVAEPRDLLKIVDEAPALGEQFEIQAVLCLIDAKNFTKVAPFLTAARAQAAFADGIAINKIDLVTPAELDKLSAVLTDLNPTASQIRISHGEIDPQWLTGLTHRQAGRDAAITRPPDTIFAASFQTDRPVRREDFLKALAKFQPYILRLKGNIGFAEGQRFVELAGPDIREDTAVDLPAAATAFTAIAWNVRKEDLVAALEKSWKTP